MSEQIAIKISPNLGYRPDLTATLRKNKGRPLTALSPSVLPTAFCLPSIVAASAKKSGKLSRRRLYALYSQISRTLTTLKYYSIFKSGALNGSDAQNIALSTNWTLTYYLNTTIFSVFAPAIGTDFNNRVGQQVHLTKFKMRGYVGLPGYPNQTSVPAGFFVRAILVLDKQNNGTVIDGNNFMDATTTSPLTSFPNIYQLNRYRILWDHNFTFNIEMLNMDQVNAGNYVYGALCRTFRVNLDFTNKPILFTFKNLTTFPDDQMTTNSLGFVMNSSTATAALNTYCNYSVRAVFYDL